MAWGAAAWADDVADFYRDKTVTMLIPAGAGGGYDLYGRTIAKHLTRHIPGNPNIIMNYLAGGGGLIAAKKMALVAPRDGSFIGIPLASVVVAQLIQPKRVDFNVGDLSWLGTIAELNTVISVWHTQNVRSLEDVKKREVTLGATQKGSFLFQQPIIVNALLGTKFKPILGYKSTADLDLAVERGEVGGRGQFWASWQSSRPDWLAQGKLVHLLQVGKTKIKELPDVPSLSQFVKTDRERAIVGFLYINTAMGRTMYAPPKLPASRLAALRKAISALTEDPEFLKDMAKRKLPVKPGSGEELEAFVKEVLRTPPDVVAELRNTLGLK
jgi:tripartite-type tricarboxylate transporter receptor subunit TctC